jgi:serine/threonine-protein kinase HipA
LQRPGAKRAGTGLPSWFENLLPDRGTELRRRLCALYSLRDGQSFALLHALGHDLLGAVEARSTDGDVGPDDEPTTSPEGATERIDEGTPRLSALTGVQMKFSMSMVGRGLALPASGPRGHWIIKLPLAGFDELPEIERTTMTWARESGFDVPEHFTPELAKLSGIPAEWIGGATRAFAVKRFDRRDDGTKIHQEDLCQALDILPGNKYGTGPPSISFDGALRFVTDFAGEPTGREMARRIGFMIASGNDDAHLKNWSLLWGAATRPTLTPCYDLVSTISWPEFGWSRPEGPQLALPLGGQRLFRHIDKGTLVAFAERSAQAWAKEEVMTGIVRAMEALHRLGREVPERMRSALDIHRKVVPVLNDVDH